MTSDIQEGLRALAAVQAVFPGAALAGGYLRDAFFGRSQKDIDIFVPYQRDIPMDSLGLSLFTTPASYMEQAEVHAVFEVDAMDGHSLPVQVIFMAEGVDVIQRIMNHDFDFCQIWHDGWGTNWSADFAHMNPREVTLVHCEDLKQFKRSMKRWDRLKAKYPDFTLIIPERFSAFQRSLNGEEAAS